MKYTELNNATYLPQELLPRLGGIGDRISLTDVDGTEIWVALQVDAVASFYGIQDEIEIIDESDELIGYLYLSSQKEIAPFEVGDIPLVAYLNEVASNTAYADESYRFKFNYAVIKRSFYEVYVQDYLHTAPLWGAFFHVTDDSKIPETYKAAISQIRAVSGLEVRSVLHIESMLRGIIQPYSFERFLKMYHLLELIFDIVFVEDVRKLSDDLRGIGKLMSRYDSKELNRLVYILETKCELKDLSKLENCLNRLKLKDEYLKKAETIFFDYEKDGNPFRSDERDKFFDLMNAGGFSHDNAKKAKLSAVDTELKYRDKILKTIAYWIYRIRSSIAHNRIGEYIMSSEDEEFVAEFAEPLLREVIRQAFAKRV